jgi:hypothetical protein
MKDLRKFLRAYLSHGLKYLLGELTEEEAREQRQNGGVSNCYDEALQYVDGAEGNPQVALELFRRDLARDPYIDLDEIDMIEVHLTRWAKQSRKAEPIAAQGG